jgi:ABC-type lipoprotein export system ATPase subunit
VSRRLFEVEGLRIAINDQGGAVRGGREPPTSVHGEKLPFVWVEAIPGVSFSVDAAETLAIIGESSSGTTMVIATHDPGAHAYVDDAYSVDSGRLHKPQ